MQKILTSSGIQHQRTVCYSPEQNGMAERMNRTLIEKARCLLMDAGLEKKFWAEAINTAAYLVNRTPCKGLQDTTPEEMWSGRKPDLKHLKVFGCQAIIHIPKEKRKKLDPKGKDVIFVGYSLHPKSYRFFDSKKKEFLISRDAVFFENQYFESTCEVENVYNTLPICDSVGEQEQQEPDYEEEEPNYVKNQTDDEVFVVENDDDIFFSQDEDDSERNREGIAHCQEVEAVEPQLRRSSRIRKEAVRNGYTTYLTSEIDEDPKTLQAAMKSKQAEKWKMAMNEEFQSLIDNNTWKVVELPVGKKPIDCKWTFKTKRNAEGNIERYKARLVIKGFSQRYGIDYQETFSPVVRYASIRLLLAIAVRYDLDIDQMDVVTAFLQSDLDEEIYMKYPDGFKCEEGKVCRLKKSLYGLKQASRVWNHKLDRTLKSIGLQQSKTEPCIYYRLNQNEIAYVAVYVDDILIFTNNQKTKRYIKDNLMRHFKMKNLGEAKYILGMQITRDRNNGKLWIDQERYIKDVLKKFNMNECNSISTPIDVNQKLSKQFSPCTEEELNQMANVPYQEAIGSIMYAAQVSRPDLTFAVGMLSKYNNNPGKMHWAAVKRVLRYLKKTTNLKLEFNQNTQGTLEGYSDADWGSNTDERKSVTGYVFKFQGGSISWGSKTQPTVALSTTEAEYMALAATSQEALWLQSLFNEISDTPLETMTIYCDNKSAINLSLNSMYHGRSKHIDIRHHFLRDLVNRKIISIEHIGTDDMAADIMTKGLPVQKHYHCCELLGCKF